MRKMLYFLSKNEVDYNSKDTKNYLPMPNIVLAEDKQSASVYRAANYKNISIMDKVYRLSYLKNIQRRRVEKNSVLIACGLHDGDFLFNFLRGEMRTNKHKIYYLKLHPRSNSRSIISKIENSDIPNIKLVGGHVGTYLSIVNEVIFTYSSVGLEAHELGVKVRSISLPGRINESPLLDKFGSVELEIKS
jgi:hypothetical protein